LSWVDGYKVLSNEAVAFISFSFALLALAFLICFSFLARRWLAHMHAFPTIGLAGVIGVRALHTHANARSRWYSLARAWKRRPQAPVANTRAGVQMIEQHNASAHKTFYDSGTCIYWFTQHRMQM
jgi:hypothetical protein